VVTLHFAAIYVLSLAIAVSTSLVISAVWGVGGLRTLARRVNDLDADQSALEVRFTRDQKRRAAVLSHEARASTTKADELLANRVLQPVAQEQVILPGR